MRTIVNPFSNTENGGCFACGETHPFGLHMQFYEDGDQVCCDWTPDPAYGGYKQILHGGIQSTLMDEIAAWAIFVKLETAGVTQRLEVDFRKPLYVERGTIQVRASMPVREGRVARVPVQLRDAEGVCCTEGQVLYHLFSDQVAKRRLGYPGVQAFFET